MKKHTRDGFALITLHLLSFTAFTLLVTAPVTAVVDPEFTPDHVYQQSQAILGLTATTMPDSAIAAEFAVHEVIKGKLDRKQITLSLADAAVAKDGVESVRRMRILVNDAAGKQAIVFIPPPDSNASALLHVGGVWLRARQTARPGELALESVDSALNATFNGGTDMLIETMRFISRYPNRPIMPVSPNVKWDTDGHTKIGSLADGAKSTAVTTIDVNGDGKPDIHVASPGGDRIFLAGDDRSFDAVAGLDAASAAAAWGDFDGDGRPDLASLSGDALKLHLQKAPGKFTPVAIKVDAVPETASPTVQAADFDADGRMDLIVGQARLPIVLRNTGDGQFKPVEMAAPAKDVGEPGPVAVADFDNDGWLDIVQSSANDGLLFRGRVGGTFAPGTACGAASGVGKHRRACLADLDGDGTPNIVFIGGSARFTAYAFKAGRFVNVSQSLGEASYNVQSAALCLAAGDFNNDTFVDLFVGYPAAPAQFFFNRGFRSFALADALKLPGEDVPGADKGQTAAAWADLDGDGSLELIYALADGSVWTSMSDLGAMSQPQAVTVKPGPKCRSAGPITVTFWADDLCLGSRRIENRFSAATMGLPTSDNVTLKWTVPGSPQTSARVRVVEGNVVYAVGD